MLTAEKMSSCFNQMNEELRSLGKQGEIGIVGGAVMCLVYNARNATKDVDAIFKPAQLIRKYARRIGEEFGLSPEWLNDAAKGFIEPGFERQSVLELSNLRVWAPETKYMLAMKCIS